MRKMTPPFPGDVKPARPGLYQRLNIYGAWCYALWTGTQWNGYRSAAADAAKVTAPSTFPSLPWRGLAKEPKQ